MKLYRTTYVILSISQSPSATDGSKKIVPKAKIKEIFTYKKHTGKGNTQTTLEKCLESRTAWMLFKFQTVPKARML